MTFFKILRLKESLEESERVGREREQQQAIAIDNLQQAKSRLEDEIAKVCVANFRHQCSHLFSQSRKVLGDDSRRLDLAIKEAIKAAAVAPAAPTGDSAPAEFDGSSASRSQSPQRHRVGFFFCGLKLNGGKQGKKLDPTFLEAQHLQLAGHLEMEGEVVALLAISL